MDAGFWHDKWESNEIGFHQSDYHPMLPRHFVDLSVKKGGRVFVPLCGKSLDMHWLLSEGYHVVGAELSEMAVEQLFEGLDLTPEVSEVKAGKLYSAPGIDVFVGDIFDLSPELVGLIDAVYDRAALVALPKETRKLYAANIRYLTGGAPQLVITFLYDQSLMAGPPFSIPDKEVASYYQGHYQVSEVCNAEVEGGLKGGTPAIEKAWLLRLV